MKNQFNSIKRNYLFLIAHLSSLILFLTLTPAQAAPGSVYMEDMNWMEIRDRVKGGATVAIIPTGGTEQNGPHMVLGKHNYIVRYTAGEIAKKLGNALVSPVVPFVPQGRISPPEGHMQFAGTVSLTQATYEALLEDIAASLKQHGFKLICFIGDHGGNQEGQRNVAARLSKEWHSDGVRVVHVSKYYNDNGQERWVESMGIKVKNPAAHAGFMDTSELMAIHALGVNEAQRGMRGDNDYRATGASGDSTLSTANYGRKLLSIKIDSAVEQIQNVAAAPQ